MKRKTFFVIIIMLLLLAVLCSCKDEPTVYTLNYGASECGIVEGETEQSVAEGKDGTAVTAVADEGYEFVKWSDGVTTATRQDKAVKANLTVTAQFQKAEIAFVVKYLSSEGGSVQGQTEQTVKQGEDATEVTAIPNEGYEFVKWSDDVTTATRQDKAVKANLTVTAQFQKAEIAYTVKYLSSEGGSVRGQTEQTVKQGKNATAVTARPNEGYEFVKWSDDVTTATRQDKAVKENITVTAIFQKIEPRLRYVIEEGGILTSGELEYKIMPGYTVGPISVATKEGYEFLGWSDGEDLPWRYDIMPNCDKTITAKFRRIDDYKLLDWYAVYEQGVPTMEINKDTYSSLHFPVPEREHFTFEGWYLGETMVADAQGKSYFTEADLDYGGRSITAKWTALETFNYKILLVYVTRIVATLPNVNPNITEKIELDYTMSEKEREFCHLLTLRTKQYLDKMLDGLVDFQVDEYYTTKTITIEDFDIAVGEFRYSCLRVQDLEEVADILPQYDSALILYDGTRETTHYSGQASMRYGEIRLDSFFQAIKTYKSSLDEVIDALKKNSDVYVPNSGTYLIESYGIGVIVHELAHTIELRVKLEDYHSCVVADLLNTQFLADLEANRLYFLNAIEKDGKKAGIPYEFWKRDVGRITYNVTQGKYGDCGHFDTNRQGVAIVSGKSGRKFDVVYGDSITVTARPFRPNEYRFVQWSDGVVTATRTDVVTGDMELFAIFEPIDYTLTIKQTEGGVVTENGVTVIEGSTYNLNVESGNILIKAVADEGYRFISWSDGDTDWQKSVWARDLAEIANEDHKVALYAIFEKLE